jgi:hypothetical protein
MKDSAKGKVAELYVANYFMEKGFYVAIALDPQCPFDLIITDKKGNCRLIDVKNLKTRKTRNRFNKIGDRIGRATTTQQKNMRIELFEIDISSCKAHYKVYNRRIK